MSAASLPSIGIVFQEKNREFFIYEMHPMIKFLFSIFLSFRHNSILFVTVIVKNNSRLKKTILWIGEHDLALAVEMAKVILLI